MTLQLCFVIDVLLLLLSLWFVIQVSDASIFNPSLWWIALHSYVVTFRLFTLNLGVESARVIGIRSETELVNAGIASDLSLLAIVAATIFACRPRVMDFWKDYSKPGPVRLNPLLGNIISILCFTIGTYALLKFGGYAIAARARGLNVSAIDIGRFNESSYPITIAGFAVQGALIQVAMKGFTKIRIAILGVLLALTFLNTFRQAFFLAAVFAFLVLQTQRNKTTLSAKWIVPLLILCVTWFVTKPVRDSIVAGEGIERAVQAGSDYITDVLTTGGEDSADTNLFDMQATFMAAADEDGRRFYGATILPLIYLPIPRFIWPDKPAVNEYAHEIASRSRPFAQYGMTPQFSGESYLNFGYAGCAFIPFLYMLGMQTAYRRVRNCDIGSAARLVYLVYLISLIQVFRDGLTSLIIFPLVVYLPLFGWGTISELLEIVRHGWGGTGHDYSAGVRKNRSAYLGRPPLYAGRVRGRF